MAEARLEVDPDDRLVQGVSGRAPARLDHVLKPVVEVGGNPPGFGGNGDAPDRFGLFLDEPVARLLPGPAVDVDALDGARGGPRVEGADVPPVLARSGDGAFAVVTAVP